MQRYKNLFTVDTLSSRAYWLSWGRYRSRSKTEAKGFFRPNTLPRLPPKFPTQKLNVYIPHNMVNREKKTTFPINCLNRAKLKALCDPDGEIRCTSGVGACLSSGLLATSSLSLPSILQNSFYKYLSPWNCLSLKWSTGEIWFLKLICIAAYFW